MKTPLTLLLVLVLGLLAACTLPGVSAPAEPGYPPPPPEEGPPEAGPPGPMPDAPGAMPPESDGPPEGSLPPDAIPPESDKPPVGEAAAGSTTPTADLAITAISPQSSGLGGMFMAQLSGTFQVTIANNGPDALDAYVEVWCGYESRNQQTNLEGPSQQNTFTVYLNLKPGHKQTFDTGLSYDTTQYRYTVHCEIRPNFDVYEDPDTINSRRVEDFGG